MNGLIDDIAVYNRGLTSSEIQAIFNAGSAGKCKGVEDCSNGTDDDGDTLVDCDDPDCDGTGVCFEAGRCNDGRDNDGDGLIDCDDPDCADFPDCVGIPPAGLKCPLSQGSWKNHPNEWPVDSLTLGNESYIQAELLTILNTPVKGDASLILARQLIAAKLNVANGSDPTPPAGAIAEADTLLSGFVGGLPYGVKPKTENGQAMVSKAGILDGYNSTNLMPDCVIPCP